MTTVNTTEQAHDIALKGLVTVFYRSRHKPKTEIEGVNYVQLKGDRPIRYEVEGIVGTLSDKVTLEPVFTEAGDYIPADTGLVGEIAGLAVVSNKDVLELLGRKRMSKKAMDLSRSVLWGVNRKSFTL